MINGEWQMGNDKFKLYNYLIEDFQLKNSNCIGF